jgi:hypothetical protein
MEEMIKNVVAFLESPIPYLVNAILVLGYLMIKKKAFRNAIDHCRCYDSRIGGGNLLGGAATLSFGIPPLILFLFYKSQFFWTLFLIQVSYSIFAFLTVVWPKLYKQGSVRIESHAFGELSLCGMVAALNIGPLYWISLFPPLKPLIGVVVDLITTVHHVCATVILGIISIGKITTGFSEKVG